MSRAIVTGATGFVGSNLCSYLVNNGWEVIIISRKSSDYTLLQSVVLKLEIFEYEGDITELIQLFCDRKADVVFHLASLFIAEHESNQLNQLVDSNITFGLHILEALKFSESKILVNTGTSWQHFHSNEYNPVDLYAATKQAFESLLKYYIEAEGVRVVTLKLFDTYGESDTRPKLVNLLHKYADEEIELCLSPGEQVMDLVHVDDVVRAFEQSYQYLLSNEVKCAEFGVGSKRPIELKELIHLFEKVTGKKLNVVWGGRKYRRREVMKLWNNYNVLPGWQPETNIEDGLKKYNVEKGVKEI